MPRFFIQLAPYNYVKHNSRFSQIIASQSHASADFCPLLAKNKRKLHWSFLLYAKAKRAFTEAPFKKFPECRFLNFDS